MTAKERREMQKLQNKISELEQRHRKDMEAYANAASELIELRTALRNIHDAAVDVVMEANAVIRTHVEEE